jgi:hypothetical protein
MPGRDGRQVPAVTVVAASHAQDVFLLTQTYPCCTTQSGRRQTLCLVGAHPTSANKACHAGHPWKVSCRRLASLARHSEAAGSWGSSSPATTARVNVCHGMRCWVSRRRVTRQPGTAHCMLQPPLTCQHGAGPGHKLVLVKHAAQGRPAHARRVRRQLTLQLLLLLLRCVNWRWCRATKQGQGCLQAGLRRCCSCIGVAGARRGVGECARQLLGHASDGARRRPPRGAAAAGGGGGAWWWC